VAGGAWPEIIRRAREFVTALQDPHSPA